MNRTVLSAIIATLLLTGVGGYKVIRNKQADIFENSIHKVTYIVDGDTVDIEDKTRIRLLGIDAPERGTCFAAEAKAYMKTLLLDVDVRIEKDITGSDRYGRLLRYVYIPADKSEDDDVFVNEHLVRQGYAKTFAVAPDNRYRDLMASAQREAKEAGRGLWGACNIEEEKSTREEDSGPSDSSCTIKGNISEKAYGKNYFLEGCPNYNRIKIDLRKGEAYFCTEEEAQAAGFSRSDSCDNSF